MYVCVLCVCRYVTIPPGSMGLYDPTEIRNRGMLLRFQKEAFVKVGYHLLIFFILLYWSVKLCCPSIVHILYMYIFL